MMVVKYILGLRSEFIIILIIRQSYHGFNLSPISFLIKWLGYVRNHAKADKPIPPSGTRSIISPPWLSNFPKAN